MIPFTAPATHWLYHAATGKSVPVGECRCLFCGCIHSEGTLSHDVVRETFTNHSMCREPGSPFVCPACAHYFCHRWRPEGHRKDAEYRKLSMRITPDGFHPWQRSEMRKDIEGWLQDGFPGGALVVALSKKKHCLPLANVSPPGCSFAIQLEESRVSVSRRDWQEVSHAFDSLIALGFAKGEILSGEPHHQTLRKTSMREAVTINRSLARWRPSNLLTLISYVTLLDSDTEPPESD